MISKSAEYTASYRKLFPMACCEVVKVNLRIIIIQRLMYAFDCAFDCAFDKSNVCRSHPNANANAFTISRRHLNAHSNAQYSNSFNKPGRTTERMWFNNPTDNSVKRRSNRRFFNVYENIDINMFSHSRKIIQLEDMR